jgi:DNA-binding MarR family transcriptional regulator
LLIAPPALDADIADLAPVSTPLVPAAVDRESEDALDAARASSSPAGRADGGLGFDDLARLLNSFRLLMLNHSRVLDHQGDLFGLGDTDIRFLFYVSATGDSVTPKRAADYLDLSSGAMTNLVDRLVDAGYLDRRRNPDDRRSVIVSRTPRGVEVTGAIAAVYGAAFAEVVPASQHRVLADTLLDLGQAFDRHGVGASPAAPAAA